MPLPLAIVAGLLGQAIVQVLTKPWPWAMLVGWLIVTRFDFHVFGDEVRKTAASLWWVFILLFAFLLAREYVRLRLQKRR